MSVFIPDELEKDIDQINNNIEYFKRQYPDIMKKAEEIQKDIKIANALMFILAIILLFFLFKK